MNLCKDLLVQYVQSHPANWNEELFRQADTAATRALLKIQKILQDNAYTEEDIKGAWATEEERQKAQTRMEAQDFLAIEDIIEVLEAYGLPTGACHDFD